MLCSQLYTLSVLCVLCSQMFTLTKRFRPVRSPYMTLATINAAMQRGCGGASGAPQAYVQHCALPALLAPTDLARSTAAVLPLACDIDLTLIHAALAISPRSQAGWPGTFPPWGSKAPPATRLAQSDALMQYAWKHKEELHVTNLGEERTWPESLDCLGIESPHSYANEDARRNAEMRALLLLLNRACHSNEKAKHRLDAEPSLQRLHPRAFLILSQVCMYFVSVLSLACFAL